MKVARRVGLVVNPTAGGGTAKSVGGRLARALAERGIGVAGLSALSAEVALENVERELDAIDALIVVGGDGMVHLGIQALAETAIPLGVVPVGTGNDFAAAVRIPLDPERSVPDLLERIASGAEPRPVDLLHVSGAGVDGRASRWVAGAVSAGLDAAVNARANRMRFPRGSSRYVLAAIREILSYSSWGYRLTVEGAVLTPLQRAHLEPFAGMLIGARDDRGESRMTWEERGALVTAANTPTIGGGIRVAPSARIDDGRIELVIAGDVGRLTAARLFPMMLSGVHLRSAHLRAVSARAVTIDSADAPDVYGDGERIGTVPVRVELRRGALHVLA